MKGGYMYNTPYIKKTLEIMNLERKYLLFTRTTLIRLTHFILFYLKCFCSLCTLKMMKNKK